MDKASGRRDTLAYRDFALLSTAHSKHWRISGRVRLAQGARGRGLAQGDRLRRDRRCSNRRAHEYRGNDSMLPCHAPGPLHHPAAPVGQVEARTEADLAGLFTTRSAPAPAREHTIRNGQALLTAHRQPCPGREHHCASRRGSTCRAPVGAGQSIPADLSAWKAEIVGRPPGP